MMHKAGVAMLNRVLKETARDIVGLNYRRTSHAFSVMGIEPRTRIQ
jgi:hypothetical protein